MNQIIADRYAEAVYFFSSMKNQELGKKIIELISRTIKDDEEMLPIALDECDEFIELIEYRESTEREEISKEVTEEYVTIRNLVSEYIPGGEDKWYNMATEVLTYAVPNEKTLIEGTEFLKEKFKELQNTVN